MTESESSSSSSYSVDDNSIETDASSSSHGNNYNENSYKITKDKGKKQSSPDHKSSNVDWELSSVNSVSIGEPNNYNRYNDNAEDLLEIDVEDEDLIEFFSNPISSKRFSGCNEDIQRNQCYEFLLDKDALEELEEEETMMKTHKMVAMEDLTKSFNVSYNSEKQECRHVEILLASSEDEYGCTDNTGTVSTKAQNSHSKLEKRDYEKIGPSPARSKINFPFPQSLSDNTDKVQPLTPPAYPSIFHNEPDNANVTLTNDSKSSNDILDVFVLSNIEIKRTCQQNELQRLGINHDCFKPTEYKSRREPIIHELNMLSRPVLSRRNVSVDQFFSHPFNKLWKAKFESFNHLQSEMCNILAHSNDNTIVSSPTGSGKTTLFEMAIVRLFALNINRGKGIIGSIPNHRKALYIAPNKALCEEKQQEWSKRFRDIDPGIVCTTITGDVNVSSSYADIASAHIILTTPEKWDSVTRRWADYLVLLGSIKLLILDEVHMIGEPERGSCLESIIIRMKTIQRAATAREFTSSEILSSSFKKTTPEAIASDMRFVAASATLPNIGQIANFIESGEAYVFDDSYRPIPLTIYVQACGHIGKSRYLFDASLNQHVPSILRRFSKGRPAIVFCHSKRDAEQLADELTKSYCTSTTLNNPLLNKFSSQVSATLLQKLLRCGIAYHHAGLDTTDRYIVEEAFVSGNISCLCSTSTLAMGVNLPSHLVVIKGTSAYRGASTGHQEIDTGTLLQMIGRAGRPGFDTSGTAVIMTDSASKQRYEHLSNGLKVVESRLMDKNNLTEALNNEISQGVISSADEALQWVKGSFLFHRIKAHPLYYGLNSDASDVTSFIAEKCNASIEKLYKMGAITKGKDDILTPTAASKIMSRNFIDLETMTSIIKLPHDSGPLQLLHLLSKCKKLQSPVRRHEKRLLNEAYKFAKYKFQGPQSKIRIQTPSEKVFVLLQSAIDQYYFEDFALRQEMSFITDGAVRILSAVEDYSKEGSLHGQVLLQSVLLSRSIYHGLWGENDCVLHQIGGVTKELAKKLKDINVNSFADVMSNSSKDMAKVCSLPPSFGDSLKVAASQILQCTLKLSHNIKEHDVNGLELLIKVEHTDPQNFLQHEKNKDNVKYSIIVFTDKPSGLLLACGDIFTETEFPIRFRGKFGRVFIHLISNLVGLDEQVTIDGNDRIHVSSFSLSPAMVKSLGKRKTQSSKPVVQSENRLKNAYGSSISNLTDFRLCKRGKIERDHESQEIDSKINQCTGSTQKIGVDKTASKAITPSPHLTQKLQRKQSVTSSSPARGGTTSFNNLAQRHCLSNSFNRIPSSKQLSSTKRVQNYMRSSWLQEKCDYKSSQQSAFKSTKENPFTSYAFDPNSIELTLDSAASISKQSEQQSIIPPSNFSLERPKIAPFGTPASRRKNIASSNRISSVDLLKQKALECQYHQQATTPRKFIYSKGIDANRQIQHYHEAGNINEYNPRLQEPIQLIESGFYPHHQQYMPSSRRLIRQPYALIHDTHFTPDYLRQNGVVSPNNFSQVTTICDGPMLRSDHSMTSGLNRFRQHHYVDDLQFDHHRHHWQHHQYLNQNANAIPLFVNEYETRYNNPMVASFNDQRFESFDVLNPEYEMQICEKAFASDETKSIQPQLGNKSVLSYHPQRAHEFYFQQGMQLNEKPPHEIIVRNNFQKKKMIDDSSLAFHDAFL